LSVQLGPAYSAQALLRISETTDGFGVGQAARGVGDRGSRSIAAQPIEAIAVVGVDEVIGVERSPSLQRPQLPILDCDGFYFGRVTK
jgi:hypothetical protein